MSAIQPKATVGSRPLADSRVGCSTANRRGGTALRWIARYQQYLIRKGKASKPEFWYFGVNEVAIPWWLPFVALLLWVVIFNPSDGLRVMVSLGVGIPALVGMVYAMGTYLASAIRAHRKIRLSK